MLNTVVRNFNSAGFNKTAAIASPIGCIGVMNVQKTCNKMGGGGIQGRERGKKTNTYRRPRNTDASQQDPLGGVSIVYPSDLPVIK